MRYTRAILSALIVLFGLLGLVLIHAQTVTTPPQPTTPCANGLPWILHPTSAKYPWQCQVKKPCARTCTFNAGAPDGSKCVADVRRDSSFIQGQLGRGTPVPIVANDPDLYHIFIYGPYHTIDTNLERDANGNACYAGIRFYYGEWPLGDPRNLVPVAPVATAATESIQTELLPLRDIR